MSDETGFAAAELPGAHSREHGSAEASDLSPRTKLIETVFDGVADGLLVVNREGRPVAANRSSEAIMGPLPAADAASDLGASLGLFLADGETPCPFDELPTTRALRRAVVTNQSMMLRNQHRPEGVRISVGARALHDEAGRIIGALMVFRDLSGVEQAESELDRAMGELQEQSHLLTEVMNSIGDGIVVADSQGNFVLFNPSAERIVGLGAADLPPEQWADHYGAFYPDGITKVPAEELPLVRAIQGESVDGMDVFVRNPAIPDGAFVSVTARPMLDAKGNRTGGVATFRDVTALRQADEAMTRAFAQGRLDVLDTVMHNIGNAINSVAIGVGTLAAGLREDKLRQRLTALATALGEHEGDLASYLTATPQGRQVLPFIAALDRDFASANEELTATLARVEASVEHIVDIIRTQRSHSSLHDMRKEAPLEHLIDDAINVVQDALARRDIEVAIDCARAPKRLYVEESRFSQMLVNLLRNAIEAIDERHQVQANAPAPRLGIVCYPEGDWLVVDVVDNGIGIEAERFKSIFAAGYTTKRLGSGLGLHATANFVINSGGHVEPISAGRCQGTTMRVSLRLASVTVRDGSEDPPDLAPNAGAN